ncbi:MAG: flagellar hook-basal body complex protein FliE [Planctomycetaceae bacterium]|nr:flagellar hook-basal body complex protein FliE [Planctomycetaceae bacterium]
MPDPLGLIGNHGQVPDRIAPSQRANASDGNQNFKQLLMKNIEQVNRLQQDAESAIEDLATGNRDDIAGVMIAKQKADLAFKTLLQVRNKLMDAYEEINQMRV